MGRVAVLKIKREDAKPELIINLQIHRDDGLPTLEIEGGRLQINSDLESYYYLWQNLFQQGMQLRGFEGWQIHQSQTIQQSTVEGVDAIRKYVHLLENNLQNCLQNSTDQQWRKIREKLTQELAKHQNEMRITIQADPDLWKFPWHSWDLLTSYPDIGISFSLENYEKEESRSESTTNHQVRILAVLGDNKNINLDPDQEAIANLKEAKTKFLFQPQASDFIETLREQNGWDIFFFAGHSETKDKTGRIYLNETVSLEIEQFKNALKEAIKKGLKIALFNSCEGLGLAEEIAKLQIPVAIFMQEKVPDPVAQFFLKEFLIEYSSEQPLHTGFRRAQERLEKFTDLPGATWLPKLYQNLGEVPPTWEALRDKKKCDRLLIPLLRRPAKLKFQTILTTVLIISFIVTNLVMGVRSLGWMQASELHAYDKFMRERPPEKPDQHLLIVEVNDQDLKGLKQDITITDQVLFKLLEKLDKLQPLVIGIDIFRDRNSIEEKDLEFRAKLTQLYGINNRLIVACLLEDSPIPGTQPLPSIPLDRLGFANLVFDPDNVLRRQMLVQHKDSKFCKTELSLSLQLALIYLKNQGFEELQRTSKNHLRIGKTDFKLLRLAPPVGGYQKMGEEEALLGYQIMLNYRVADPIAKTVSLTDVLTDKVPAEWVKGKIVLIGYTNQTENSDLHSTPYSAGHFPYKTMPGVIIHAHMVSQIISAVEDKRSLINVWSLSGEYLWVYFWSVVGGGLIFVFLTPVRLGLATGVAFILLEAACRLLLIQGYWVPLIPARLALLITGLAVVTYTQTQNQQHNKVSRYSELSQY